MVRKIFILVFVSLICGLINSQVDEAAISSGIEKFDKVMTGILLQLDDTMNKAQTEVSATFNGVKEIANGMQKVFVSPVQNLVSNMKDLPQQYQAATQKIQEKNMTGLKEIGTITRNIVNNTLQSMSSMIKNIDKIAWKTPFNHTARLLQITISSLRMLRTIIESAAQDLVTSVAQKKDFAVKALKSITKIDEALEQMRLLASQLSQFALSQSSELAESFKL